MSYGVKFCNRHQTRIGQSFAKRVEESKEEDEAAGKAHMIESLPVGKYTLREESAPYGYKVASDGTFEVKEIAEIQKVSITWKYAHIFFSIYFDLYLTTTAT